MADDDYERKPAASSSPPRSRDPERKERVRGDSPARGSPPRGSPPRDRARDESPRGSRGRDEKRDGREDPRSRSRSADRRPERPIYCGNYEYDMPETEIKNVFEEYGDVERIDMKTGFCFIYMLSERAAERAIRKLHGRQVGRRMRPLHVQYAKTKDADRKRVIRPSTTLFVVNFDVARVRERDVERHFEPYGRIKRVEIKKSYAFVQYENLEDAEYAMKKTHLSTLDGRTVTVEYVQNEDPNAAKERGPHDGGGRDDFGGRGGRDEGRGGGGRRRSPSRSPVRRGSPIRRGRSFSR